MRILCDTNTIFSVLYHDGIERWFVEQAINRGHTIVVTDSILAELDDVLHRKLPKNRQQGALQLLAALSYHPSVWTKKHDQYTDLIAQADMYINKKDAPILAAGLQEEIGALVSGDKDFIKNPKLRSLRKKKIFTTREMLERL